MLVKWVNDDMFPKISEFWTCLWSIIIFLRTSELFGTSSEIFEYSCVLFENPGTPRVKFSHLWVRKSWQICYHLYDLSFCSQAVFFVRDVSYTRESWGKTLQRGTLWWTYMFPSGRGGWSDDSNHLIVRKLNFFYYKVRLLIFSNHY